MDLATRSGTISWRAVSAAAVSMFVLGGAWYGAVFVRPWQHLSGLSDEDVATGIGRVFATAVASVAIAVVLALFVGPDAGLAVGATAGLLAGAGWVLPAMVMTNAFERRPTRLTMLDAGYHVVAFTVAGGLLGLLG